MEKNSNIYENIKCICSHTIYVYIYSILLRYITHIIKYAVYISVCTLIDSPCCINITNFRLFLSLLKEIQCSLAIILNVPHMTVPGQLPTFWLHVSLIRNNSAVNISASSCMHMFPILLGICLEVVLLDCM